MEYGSMKPREFSALLLLAAIWGVSFLLIRIAAPVLGPLTLVNARMLIASSALLIYALAKRRAGLGLRQSWKAYLMLGMLNSVLPMTLEAVALMYLSPSLVAILVTTVPPFTALAAAVWIHEALTPAKLIGLLLGIVGVGVIVGWGRSCPRLPSCWALVRCCSRRCSMPWEASTPRSRSGAHPRYQ
jgi:drug/metabolite transporter (DMT)-like permease